jgi:uncharacterized spore protein YtfJ
MAEQKERPARAARTRRKAEVVAPTAETSAMPSLEGTPRGALAIIERARDVLTVRRVFGEPIERDGITLIPAAKVRGGGGGGGDTEGNGGGGFGVSATPAGAYVIKDGTVRWEPALDLGRTIFMGQLVGIVALLTLRSIVKTLAKRR